jgi:hypothetical protein
VGVLRATQDLSELITLGLTKLTVARVKACGGFHFWQREEEMKGDEFYQKLEKLMPWLPKVFAKLGNRLENFDPHQPVTMIAEMEKDIDKLAKRVKAHPRLIGRGMRLLMKHPYFAAAMTKTMQVCIRRVERQLADDPRAAQLTRLIEQTDREVQFRSWLVLQNYVDMRLLFRPLCLAGTAVEDARKLKGEAKAAVLIEALGKTCEVLYHPYVLGVWQLTCLSRDKWPTEPVFGNLIRELPPRLSTYPELVDSDADWMRNAARHERWYPIPGEDAIWMERKRGRQERVTFAELEVKIRDMNHLAGVTFPFVAIGYLFRKLLTETGAWSTLEKMLPTIVETGDLDGSNDAAIEKQFESELRAVREKFAPLIAFVQSRAPAAGAQ